METRIPEVAFTLLILGVFLFGAVFFVLADASNYLVKGSGGSHLSFATTLSGGQGLSIGACGSSEAELGASIATSPYIPWLNESDGDSGSANFNDLGAVVSWNAQSIDGGVDECHATSIANSPTDWLAFGASLLPGASPGEQGGSFYTGEEDSIVESYGMECTDDVSGGGIESVNVSATQNYSRHSAADCNISANPAEVPVGYTNVNITWSGINSPAEWIYPFPEQNDYPFKFLQIRGNESRDGSANNSLFGHSRRFPNQYLYNGHAVRGDWYAVQVPTNATNYTLEFMHNHNWGPTQENPEVVIRTNHRMDRGYAIRFIRRGGVNLYKRTPGWPEKDYNHELIDSLPQFGEGSLYFPEGHYTTRVVVSGSNIKVYRVDSGVPTLLLEHNDSTFPSGGIGFSARSANFRVKDIKLTYNSLPDPALPYQQIECTVSAVGELGMLNTTFLPFQAFGTTITNVGPIPAGGQQFKVRCENFDASSFCEETVDVTIGTGPAVSIVPLSSAISSGSTQGLTWTVNGPADSCSFTTSGVSSPKFSWNNIIFSNFETSPGSNIYTNGYTHTDTTEGPHDYTLECSNSGVFSNIETATVTVTNPCGNNTVDAGEECDPGDPADWGAYGQQCTDHPEHNDETGTVTCTGLCQYDYGSCIGGGPCCDGYDNDNDWLIDENDPGCWELGGDPSSHFCNPEGEDNCGNGLCEPITSENPVSCPDDCTVVDTGER